MNEQNTTYADLLQFPEWKEKRIQILERDSYTCQNKECNRELPPNSTIKYIWSLERYMELSKYNSYEINFENKCISFDNKNNSDIHFLKNINIESSSILIINYSSIVGKFVIPSYKAATSLEELNVLNVHHQLYIIGRKPWEYKDEALITLCSDCHREVHRNEKIPVYTEEKVFSTNAILCDRCEGSGYLPEYHYNQNGLCFKCSGEGVVI